MGLVRIRKLDPTRKLALAAGVTMIPLTTFGLIAATQRDVKDRWILMGVYGALVFLFILSLMKISTNIALREAEAEEDDFDE